MAFKQNAMTIESSSWLDTPENGWTPIRIPADIESDSFLTGDETGRRVQLRLYRRNEGITAKVWFGPGAQGPPGHAHGGSIAAVLDQIMGSAAWAAGHIVLAGELVVRFRRKLPLETLCIVEAGVEAVEGRKVRTRGAIRDREGLLFAEGEALFIEVDASSLGELGRKAEEWLERSDE